MPLVVPLILALCSQSSCTAPTPGYCADNGGCHSPGQICSASHSCLEPDAAGDAAPNNGDGGQAAGDAATDAPADGLGGDSGVGGAGDAGDAGDASDASGPVDTHVGCNGNHDCTADPARPVCQYSSGTCFGCLASTDCADAQAPVCDLTVRQCVQCLTSTDCADPTRPVCEAKICRGCKADSECTGIGPRVCMSHIDGHCAIDDETVYVQNDSQASHPVCSDAGRMAGSSTVPFCGSQMGIDAAIASRPQASDAGVGDRDGAPGAGADADGDARGLVTKDLVVMRGPNALAYWSFGARGSTLTVVGQQGASIFPGTLPGITLDAGTLYVRDLRVHGGTAVGVRAVTGGELHLDRMFVDTNAAGGIFIDGANFEITNSVITGNGQGSFGVASWSGILIGSVPTTGRAILQNDTIVGNLTGGIVCVGDPRTSAGLLVWNNATANVVQCSLALCCGGAVDPLLNPGDYHLTAGSPCRNQLGMAMSTPFDIDGQARPTNTLSDCGADEYIAPPP